jgi:catechol 2,3-dioxygenase-like lactoylglutathione lyase family enzyme
MGINVEDLEAAKIFFTELGFSVVGEMGMQGELVDRVIGLKDVKDDLVMLQAPDGQLNLELVKFHHPVDAAGVQPSAANTLGLRHLCFEVEGLDEILASLQQKGHKLVGEVQTYEDSWKLCYIRGPEEIIIELAEQLEK